MRVKSSSTVLQTAMVTSILVIALIVSPVSAGASPKQGPISAVKGLGVKWWQWAFSFSSNDSPLTDATGARCDKGDLGGVFFLAGVAGPINTGEPVERTCNVPISKSQFILFPILNGACLLTTPCANANEPVNNIKEMQNQLKGLVDGVRETKAFVDGVQLDTSNSRVQSKVFEVKVADNSPFDQPPDFPTPPGKFIATADGYWLFLKPLSQGPHTIHVQGFVPISQTQDFVIDVTYHITVK
jgi:hypothetical protein